jgi:hypothetical protein
VLPDRRWSRLQQLLADVLRTDDELGLASVAASATLDLLDASSVSVGRFDSERGALQVLVNDGDLAAREQPHPVDESYPMTKRPSVAEMASTKRAWTVLTGDPSAPEEQVTLAELGKESAMGCPILLGDRMWGELYVTRRARRRFTPDEVAVAETVTSVLALALHRLTGTEERELADFSSAVLEDAGVREKLQSLTEVAQQTAATLRAAAWWVSIAPAGSSQLADVAGGIDRDPHDLPFPDLHPVRSYRLEDYPATAAAVRGGGCWVSLHDPNVDPDEAAFLAEFGYRGNLVAGGTCPRGHRWLVEVFLDAMSIEPDDPGHRTQEVIDAVARAVSGDEPATPSTTKSA